jgi:hypothetical protein
MNRGPAQISQARDEKDGTPKAHRGNSRTEAKITFVPGDYMRFDAVTALWGDFPDPAEQARAILESCDDNVDAARSLVAARFKFARDIEELRYWCQVEELLSKEASTFNLNASSDEEAQR